MAHSVVWVYLRSNFCGGGALKDAHTCGRCTVAVQSTIIQGHTKLSILVSIEA